MSTEAAARARTAPASAPPVPGKLRAETTIPIPKGAKITVGDGRISVEGPLGRVTRPFPSAVFDLRTQGDRATLKLLLPPGRKQARALFNTWERHLANLLTGVTRGFEARLKVVAAHFPMKVQVREHELVIENFLGEKYPRSAPLAEGIEAKVEGDIVQIAGRDIEQVGQCAATIERATRIRDYDPRVFQDGIYLIERARPKGDGA
jgi:large subunit ribosomal protein L6